MIKCIYTIAFLVLIQINFVSAQNLNWQWATSGGGTANAQGSGISFDPDGNSYVTGRFFTGSIELGGITLTNNGNSFDCFIAKYDPSGNVLWAKSAGGISYDAGIAISNDGNGNVYVTGFFESAEINFGGIFLFNPDSTNGNSNYFIAKYSTDGNVLWAKSIGSIGNPGNIQGSDIRTDASGNSYVTGEFGADTIRFDTISLVNSDPNHGEDIFVAKYDSSGNVIWAKRAGPTYVGGSNSISIDNSGNSYIIGEYNTLPGINFENINLPGGNNFDVFLAKYDPVGNVNWAKRIGGSDRDFGRGVCVDGDGNIYVTGYFENDTLVLGNDTLISKGLNDAFVAKYDSSGSPLWASAIGGPSDEYGLSITTDQGGNIVLSGIFASYPFVVNSDTLIPVGAQDIFIVKFNNAGAIFWAQSYGGIQNDFGSDIDNDGMGNIIFTGGFASNNISFGSHTLINSLSSGINMFVAKGDVNVGIEKIKNENSFAIYPNPTHDFINILLNKSIYNGRICIFNVMGEVVYSNQITGKQKSLYYDLKPGIYFIRVTDENNAMTGKFINE